MLLPIFSFNFNAAVVLLVFCNTVAYQNVDLAVGRTPLIISHDVQLISQYRINTDRKTFYRHKITPL